MAAPKGNEFYKLRSKHGRDRLFKTPQDLMDAAYEYFKWCDENPWQEETIVKYKDSYERVNVAKARPYTMQGLCRYLHCNTVYFNHFESSLEGKKDEISKDFSKVLTHVREIIYQQKFEGASSGFFNASIIARDLSLTDKTETSHTGKVTISSGVELPPNGED